MSRNSRTCAGLITVALVLGAGGLASAQGKGGGGGGGGSATTAAGALYGDLYVIERDGAGVPITKSFTYDVEGAPVVATCVQPLAADCTLLPLWGQQEGFDPELYDPCAVYTPYTDQIQEVKFGRESVSRAPATVIDKSYAEALKGINSAAGKCDGGYAIKLDPAGRITLCLQTDETDPVTGEPIWAWKTIDAPLENLGLYREVMTKGCLGTVTDEVIGEEGVPVLVTFALRAVLGGSCPNEFWMARRTFAR